MMSRLGSIFFFSEGPAKESHLEGNSHRSYAKVVSGEYDEERVYNSCELYFLTQVRIVSKAIP